MSEAIARLSQIFKTIDGRPILQEISLSVFPSEVLTILGPNGSGKTTILHTINFLMQSTKGSLYYSFAGCPFMVNPQKEKERNILKRQMHLVFQKPVVFMGTVLENCMVCGFLRGIKFSKAEAMDALERTGIAHLYCQSARTLSGGEMTRLSLARAWLIKPQLLLLDEPSANLDPEGIQIAEELVMSMMKKFSAGIVLVTQDIFQAKRISDKVAFLFRGRVIEIQSNSSFFKNPCAHETRQFLAGEIVL